MATDEGHSKKKKKRKAKREKSRKGAEEAPAQSAPEQEEEQKAKAEDEPAARPFERKAEAFTMIAKSVIFAEPTRYFSIGYYLILVSVVSVLIWSSVSFTNISHFASGEVRSPEPDVDVAVEQTFRVGEISVSAGKTVRKAERLMSYVDTMGSAHDLLSPVDGTVTKVTPLRKGIDIDARTVVTEIEPDDKAVAVRLFLDGGLVGKVGPGDRVIFTMSGLGREDAEIIQGQVTSVPIPEGDKYVAQAEFSQESLDYLKAKHFKLMSGYPLTAEIVFGRQRLISLLFRERL
jgi:hypothetical protein